MLKALVGKTQVGINSVPGEQGPGDPQGSGILYTSQYSILVLGTSASSLAWPIHFSSSRSHILFIP